MLTQKRHVKNFPLGIYTHDDFMILYHIDMQYKCKNHLICSGVSGMSLQILNKHPDFPAPTAVRQFQCVTAINDTP